MTYHEAEQAECSDSTGDIALVIQPRLKDLGEFSVRRVLPAQRRRMVGPFVFFDHMGPATFAAGQGIAVRPHPHIGLATITYLFDGAIMHRDSLGIEQSIEAGAVNLMTAGRGIVHSERAGTDLGEVSSLHGIQSWMALPEAEQEIAPDFEHYPAHKIPETTVDGVHLRIIMGTAFGQSSPVKQYSPTLYLEGQFPAGTQLTLPRDCEELAIYVVSGRMEICGDGFEEGTMVIAGDAEQLALAAPVESRVMIIGGSALGRRHLFWNFVSTSKERIEQAKDDWANQRFTMVPGDDEFIPLPD